MATVPAILSRCRIVSFALLFVLATAAAAPLSERDLAALVGFPRGGIDLYPARVRDAWRSVLEADRAQIDEWLASGDGRTVGVAVWALSVREDLNGLAAVSHLLDSQALSLPTAEPGDAPYPGEELWTAGRLERVPRVGERCTVGSVVAAAYFNWFGVTLSPRTKVEFDKRFEGVTAFDSLGYPVLKRLMKARSDLEAELAGEARKTLLAQIAALAESSRWGVIATGVSMGAISEEEGRSMMRTLSPELREQLNGPDDVRCDEPFLRPSRQSAAAYEVARSMARKLLAGP